MEEKYTDSSKNSKKGVLKGCKKAIKKLFQYIREKGREYITIMLIPHSEEKIFNFRISNFVLFFFFTLILLLTIGGSYFFVDRGTKEQELISLTDEYLKRSSDLRSFVELVSDLKDRTGKLSTSLDALQKLTGGESNLLELVQNRGVGGPGSTKEYALYNKKELQKNTLDNKAQGQSQHVQEIEDFILVNKKLGFAEDKVRNISSLLKGYRTLLNDMPSIFPVLGSRIGRGIMTSGFGWRRDPFTHKMAQHYGIDIHNITGTPVLATGNGQVVRMGYSKTMGLYVTLEHKLGFSTRYLHLSKIIVQQGDEVRKGQIIGHLGNTGRSTGPHLHYEVRVNKVPINPYPFISLDRFENLSHR